MSGDIRVTVCKWGDGRPLMLRWTDPISGRRKTKSSGTTNQRKAERLAGELERELRAGITLIPSRITWAQFRERFENERLCGMPDSTAAQYRGALNHVARVLDPDRLCKLTTQAVSRFAASLRREGMKASTLAKTLRHLKAALRWAEKQGYLTKAPIIEMPKTAARMKGRAITTEEFERMLAAVPKVRKNDPERWERLLRGLWLSGLRVSEALSLSWDGGPFRVDLEGKHPVYFIQPEGQKSGKAEVCPMTPDFATMLLETPEAERTGLVFGLNISRHKAGRALSRMGEKANIVVDPETGKTASAHDLRRSFGTRWASRVMPAVLQRLMRHASITTTLGFYVSMGADDVASQLWEKHAPEPKTGADGNIPGNIGQRPPSKRADENGRKSLSHNK